MKLVWILEAAVNIYRSENVDLIFPRREASKQNQ